MLYDEIKKDLTPEQITELENALEQCKELEGYTEEVANLRKALYGKTISFAELLGIKNRLKAQLKQARDEKACHFNTLIAIYSSLAANPYFEKIKYAYEKSVLASKKGDLLKQQYELEKQIEELKRP